MPLSSSKKRKFATTANLGRAADRFGSAIFTTSTVFKCFGNDISWLQLILGLFIALCVVPVAYFARQQKIDEYFTQKEHQKEDREEDRKKTKTCCKASVFTNITNVLAVPPIPISALVGTFALGTLLDDIVNHHTHRDPSEVEDGFHYSAIVFGLLFAIGTTATFFLYQGHRSNQNFKGVVKQFRGGYISLSLRFLMSWSAGMIAAFVYGVWCYFFGFYGTDLLYKLSHRHFGLTLTQHIF